MIILSDDLQETIARIFLYSKNYQLAIIFQTREKQEVFRQGLIEKLKDLPDWCFFNLKINNKSLILT